LLIEEYFARIRNFVNSLAIVQKFEIETEARADYIGFIRGIVYFQDGTILHIREFVDIELSTYRSLIFLMQMTFINLHFLALLLIINTNKGHYCFNLFVMHTRR
jgi:hypothetical protein